MDIEEILERLRSGLARKGDWGRFLLSRIDEAMSEGMEENQDELVIKRGKVAPSGERVAIRRAPTSLEALYIHLGVLQTYLRDLPAIATTALTEFERLGVASVSLSLDPDLEEGDRLPEPKRTVELISLLEIADDRKSGRELKELTDLLRTEDASDAPAQ